jgi:hypothetical protein
MVIDWLYLVVGLVLLWFPRQWMRLGKAVLRRRRATARVADEPWAQREPGDPRLRFGREFSKARNYFDLLRAVAGTLAVVGWQEIPASILPAPGATSRMNWTVQGIQLGILLVGLLVQTLRTEHKRINFFAPVFFIAGLSVPLCSPWAAFFAFVLVWGANPMLQNPQAFLSLYSLLLIAFGMFFRGPREVEALAAGLMCFFPTLLSMLARRPLLVFSRKGFHSSHT